MIDLRLGDCLVILRELENESVDSIVTDPPAGISFMGKEWDKDRGGKHQWIAWMESVAQECMRVLKPGGHAVVWALPRTSHWTGTAWEDAGFEVRDVITHVFGSGFPKSLDVGKAIDREAGVERKVVGKKRGTSQDIRGGKFASNPDRERLEVLETAPATPEAVEWDGWGTALKPAVEFWWLFRKPLSEKTVAKNVLKWGTGALNIDACRVPGEAVPVNKLEKWSGFGQMERPGYEQEMNDKGRFPANLVHDGSEEVKALFPNSVSSDAVRYNSRSWGDGEIYGVGNPTNTTGYKDEGSAARFFYTAKPSSTERNWGVVGIEKEPGGSLSGGADTGNGKVKTNQPVKKNFHPTVKPLALMTYLIVLVTPKGGTVLDPFMGSGTTLVACKELGRNGIGIEQDLKYFKLAQKRVGAAALPLFTER